MTTGIGSANLLADDPPFGALTLVRPVHAYRPWLIGLVYLLALFPLTVKIRHSGNVLSRYMTIEAIVEKGTLAVERTPMIAQGMTRPVDMVKFGEHYYSDKPPVLVALASPIYAVLALFGVRFTGSWHQPAPGVVPGLPWDFVVDNLAITWLTSGVASALILVWMRRLLQAVPLRPIVADLFTVALGLGTQVFTWAVTFNNHSVAAAAILGAMTSVLLERRGHEGRGRFLAGLLAGLAAVIDLPAGCLTLAGLGAILAVRARSIPLLYAAGAVGPLLLHGWLQAKVTGTPLPVEMYPQAFVYPGSFWLTPEGTFQEYGSRPWFLVELLLGPPGWLTLTPALVFGLAGLAMVLTKRGDPLRPMAAVVGGSLAVLLIYYAFVVRRTDFAGQSFGTRHLLAITPAVYFFGAVAFSRFRGRWAPLVFVLLTAVGGFYAYHGMIDPWARIEEREQKEPTLQLAQRYLVIYPYSRTRHKFELERATKSEVPTSKGRP
jgi:hypothetical protein